MIWRKNEILGRMNERIIIETVSESRTTSGSFTESWSTFATVWAYIDYQKVGTDEKEMVAKQTTVKNIEFTIRHRTDITEKMRINYDSRYYDIDRITYEPEKQFMVLEAKAYK
jgi:SPP1 family predicted phage head-tail adaptor|tara:strand:+ start:180 stop:518 length:339 start_codon:yes stop_codon:yes gene_type:complete